MKYLIVILFICLINLSTYTQDQKEDRVADAIKEKGGFLDSTLAKYKLKRNRLNIIIVAYKDAKLLEVYAKDKKVKKYFKLASYEICSSSGKLGPKRMEGDLQVPEGFYYIQEFYPLSSFHLSMLVSYPNESDKKKSKAEKLGGEICIHGACFTVGCLPMTDDKIKEIYLYAYFAKESGQTNIPVYIFPFEMTDDNFNKYCKEYSDNKELIDFWKNLKQGYDKFQSDKKKLIYTIDRNGDYLFR